MNGPPIREGALAFSDGVVRAVGAWADVSKQFPHAAVIDRPGSTLLPGLVNAHTHLELSALSRGEPPGSFVEWLSRLIPRGNVDVAALHASAARGVVIGVRQCLRFGVTAAGDISRHCRVTRPLLGGGPMRVVSYGEVQAMGMRRGLLDERIAVATDTADASDRLTIGLTPHAPYSVETGGYRACVETARRLDLPLATHLAESADEAAFLADHAGPFRTLWDSLGAWDENVPRFAGGPIRMAAAVGLLAYPTLLAHVNYCDDAEMELLAAGRASVAYCPRTHAYFGHPPHRWREMRARGICVAAGTDSCASSPDLNLVDELRLLHRLAPEVPPIRLWEMATVHAASAIGLERVAGVLTPGRPADFIAFESMGTEPLRDILESNTLPAAVWIGGRLIDADALPGGVVKRPDR